MTSTTWRLLCALVAHLGVLSYASECARARRERLEVELLLKLSLELLLLGSEAIAKGR